MTIVLHLLCFFVFTLNNIQVFNYIPHLHYIKLLPAHITIKNSKFTFSKEELVENYDFQKIIAKKKMTFHELLNDLNRIHYTYTIHAFITENI